MSLLILKHNTFSINIDNMCSIMNVMIKNIFNKNIIVEKSNPQLRKGFSWH